MPSPPVVLLLLQLAATLAMTGVIWIVQRVHYPLFARVGAEGFAEYERRHAKRIGPVVAPLMLIELGTATAMLFARPDGVPAWCAIAGMALVAIVWLSTLGLQVPCHARLSRGFDPRVHARLVRTNWIRTAAWTARSVLLLWMVGGMMAA